MTRKTASRVGASLVGALTPTRRRAAAFAKVLDGAAGPYTQEERTLAAVAAELRTIPVQRTGEMNPEVSARLRQRLVAVATVQGIGTPQPGAPTIPLHLAHPNGAGHLNGALPPEEPNSLPTCGHGADGPHEGRHRRLGGVGRRLAAAATGLATVLSLAGVASASTSALPGDTLYGVKRTVESVRLTLAGSDLDRGHIELALAERRLVEVARLLRQQRQNAGHPGGGLSGSTVALVGKALGDMDASTRTGASLLIDVHEEQGMARPVADLEVFARDQRTHLQALLPDLPPAVRPDAGESLALLDRLLLRAGSMLGEPDAGDAAEGTSCAPPCGSEKRDGSGQATRPAVPSPSAAVPAGGPGPTGTQLGDEVKPRTSDETQDTGGSIDSLLDDLLGGEQTTSGPSPSPTSAPSSVNLDNLLDSTLSDADSTLDGTGL